MPLLRVETNIPSSSFPADFKKELSALTAQLTGKPEKYISLAVVAGMDMMFGGTDEPCGSVTLTSIGKISPEENLKYSKEFSEFFKSKIGLPADRSYIAFFDLDAHNIGWDGLTFGERRRLAAAAT